jgi:hypothetical protein
MYNEIYYDFLLEHPYLFTAHVSVSISHTVSVGRSSLNKREVGQLIHSWVSMPLVL